jgi:hypothetical protein
MVDSLPQDHPSVHYFYHHCYAFRYIKANQVTPMQGFRHICYHSLTSPDDEGTIYLRCPLQPDNPLLTWQEDEFLYHASVILARFGRHELANNLRDLRTSNLELKEHIVELFNNGYIDPLHMFDSSGKRRPIRWDLQL